MKAINVLSLFDGISCGRVAVDRAGFAVDKYYASEVDKFAEKISRDNYPDIIRLGDVTKWKQWPIDWASIDLILAGSPCQGFSFSGKQLAFDDPRSALFFVFVDILSHVREKNPAVRFLLENVKMKAASIAVITETVGVAPIAINSALVSAQSRPRIYWANWPTTQPKDRGIFLSDILLNSVEEKHTISAKWKIRLDTSTDVPKKFSAINPPRALCMTARQYTNWKGTFVAVGDKIRRLSPVECERLQTLPDNYTRAASDTQRYKSIGNGWTVDVIAHLLTESGLAP